MLQKPDDPSTFRYLPYPFSEGAFNYAHFAAHNQDGGKYVKKVPKETDANFFSKAYVELLRGLSLMCRGFTGAYAKHVKDNF